ncbi:MAG: DUF2520 domain-containing protein [Bacteroidales bacterium]|jgi:predicted short-subunit dehydrogenase-like oxidoreductase (DUF2520 family)|nr:DUF2520 domain-containing protein [Bacteroidales bacterium]
MQTVMIGAGNVAVHLSKALQEKGNPVVQVYSRSAPSAAALAGMLDTDYTTSVRELRRDAELYVMAVSDDAVPEVLSTLPLTEQLIVHTAGSVPIGVFDKKMHNYGVLYPLQSFSKQHAVDLSGVPVFLEANTPSNLKILWDVAEKIFSEVYEATSEKRLLLHVAAVFASNFTNSLYGVAAQLLQTSGFAFDVLCPLVMETARKAAASGNPVHVQTGPARRNDQNVLCKHIELLAAYPQWQQLYLQLSETIKNQHRGKD